MMVSTGTVLAVDGSAVEIEVESVCVHGDSPGAVGYRRRRSGTFLLDDGVDVAAFAWMRLRLGRPDIGATRTGSLCRPRIRSAPLSVTWLGVSTLHVDDGTSALLTDGFFSRPGMLSTGLATTAFRTVADR